MHQNLEYFPSWSFRKLFSIYFVVDFGGLECEHFAQHLYRAKYISVYEKFQYWKGPTGKTISKINKILDNLAIFAVCLHLFDLVLHGDEQWADICELVGEGGGDLFVRERVLRVE